MPNKITQFANLVIKHPFLVIFISLLIAGFFASGARNLEFDTNYRVFFDEHNQELADFEKLEKTYSKSDNIFIVVKPKNGDIFNPQTLKLVQEITNDSWKLLFSQRVDSISNFQHSYAKGDELVVADLIEKDALDLNQAEIDQIRNIALQEPLLVKKIINKSGNTTGVNIVVNLPKKDFSEVPEVVFETRQLITKYSQKYPDIEIRASGMVFMNNAFIESAMHDMGTLMPIMFVALMVIMIFLVRSFLVTIATLFVIVFSAICAMGFGGLMSFPLTAPSAATPTIVLTLAIADSIHIIISMIKLMQKGMNKKEAIIESMRINFQPVFLTSLTTVVGFLGLNFSESPPFWHLGNMAAFGIASAFVFSITLLPALLTILPIQIKEKSANQKNRMDSFASFVIKNNRILLVLSILVIAGLTSMIRKIEVNDQFIKYFDHSIEFRGDSEFVMNNLSGIYNAEYSIPAAGNNSINDPEYLQNLEKFSNWLKTQPEVDHVFSITDIFKRLNKNMHNNDQSWYKIPDSKELAAQYLLLYEFSLPYGLDLTDRINIDKSASRLSVTLKDLSTNQMHRFKEKSQNWIKENLPVFMDSSATSPAVIFASVSRRNLDSMLYGNLFSLILISLIIILALRNVQIGLLSLIPNLVPIALGFGIWALLIGQINMAAAFAFAVCLGIIVDDTIHFLSKYLRAKRENGLDTRQAVRYAFNHVGVALLVTTIILIGGFMVLAQSAFQVNSYLGMLSTIIIGCALITDFILLPSLLIWIDDLTKKFKKNA